VTDIIYRARAMAENEAAGGPSAVPDLRNKKMGLITQSGDLNPRSRDHQKQRNKPFGLRGDHVDVENAPNLKRTCNGAWILGAQTERKQSTTLSTHAPEAEPAGTRDDDRDGGNRDTEAAEQEAA
jgi:hypothetical protein